MEVPSNISTDANYLYSGLVSVTFRQLAPREIVALAATAGLSCIEWGGDVHVPPGNLEVARTVGELTRDFGLTVACYGSYYRAAATRPAEFETILACAAELCAPVIRVWAGGKASADSTEAEREAIASDLRRICSIAGAANIQVAVEFHGGTLTDTVPSALALIGAVDHPSLRTLWQPNRLENENVAAADIDMLAPWIAHVHCFQWTKAGRRPLREGTGDWTEYVAHLRSLGRPVGVLLEFVSGDSPKQLLDDAAELRRLIVQ